MKKIISYLVAFLSILSIVSYLYIQEVEPLKSFSLRFNDINFDLQQKEIDKDIVFVAVDEPSVNRYGRWPWHRDILAQGIEKLSQADVVLIDMIFSEATMQKEDEKLIKSLGLLKNSVCGFFLRDKSTQILSDEELDILSDSALDLLQSQIVEQKNPLFISAPHAEINIASIMESCTFSGSFSTLSESDHLLRSYPVAVYFNDILYPSLAVQGLRLKFDSDIKRVDSRHVEIANHNIGVDNRGFVRLNFYKRSQYHTISFLDIMDEKVKPDYFKGKIVILGITEVGAGDVASTPIGNIPGPLLHYTFLSNILQNHLIKEPKYVCLILIILMISLPFLLILLFKDILHRVIFNFIVYVALYGIVRYLFISQMIYIDLFYPLISLILSMAVVEIIAFNLHERSTRFIKNAFSNYLSAELLAQLVKNPKSLSLGGEKKELTILFSDIRGFTTISESMDPVSLINLLNRYFTPMTNAVLNYGGMLDKYIGDAVMAFFNAPVDVKNHANFACYAALEMIEKLDELNEELKNEDIKPIRIGIGINTADVVVGNMGSDTRFNYTVIGDGVNLASRVEGLTKNYGVDILITEFTIDKLTDDFIYRKIEPVKVKGKDEAVVLYQLLPHNESSIKIKELYNQALQTYIDGDLSKAEGFFGKLIDDYDDNPSKYFLKNIKNGHPWGVNRMTTK